VDDREHSEDQVEEHVPGGRGGLRVGAYEGLRAGEAIVAVRERGLRPSLERVEGCAEDQHGFVVSQEPVAGSEVAADSQVFLYIGAPARAGGLGALGSGVVEDPAVESAGTTARRRRVL
jgi:PASTA domain